ncbi:hypothetical protein ACJX0J_012570, partial [Zea mays]
NVNSIVQMAYTFFAHYMHALYMVMLEFDDEQNRFQQEVSITARHNKGLMI